MATSPQPARVLTELDHVRISKLLKHSGMAFAAEDRALTLCYPPDADPNTGFASVLSPVGSALLGLAEGQMAHWSAPGGEPASAKILKVVFQPEESGDYLR